MNLFLDPKAAQEMNKTPGSENKVRAPHNIQPTLLRTSGSIQMLSFFKESTESENYFFLKMLSLISTIFVSK